MASEKLFLAAESAGNAAAAKGGGAQDAGVTRGIRVPREQFDSHERRFFEHRLRATGVNVKQVRLEKVSKPFEQHRKTQERIATELDSIENQQKQDLHSIHRFSTRERLRQNKFAKEEWTRAGIEQWEINMQVKAMREYQEMSFATRMKQKQQDKDMTIRTMATAEVQDGVSAFETGLLNLGLVSQREVAELAPRRAEESDDSDDDREELQPEKLLAATTQAATSAELTQAMEARMPSQQELEQGAGLFLRKNKESKRAGSIARKERERRRRRVLVEQQREQDLVEETKLEEVLVQKLRRESLEEQAISYSVWRTKRYEDVIVGNRQLRQKSYASRGKQAHAESLKQDHTLLDEALEDMHAQGERERIRYRAFERGRQSKLRAKLSEECEGILELVASMAVAALHQEQLTDKSEVDDTLWLEWMAKFEASEHVSAPEPLTTSAVQMYPLTAEPPQSTDPVLEEAALREYLTSSGQWETQGPAGDEGAAEEGGARPSAPARFDASAEMRQIVESEGASLSFASQLCAEVDFVDGRPVNYRLGIVIAAMLDRRHPMPTQPDPPPMPQVPLKLVMTGKPFAGKRTLATRIANSYNLQVVDVDELIREALALSRRPDIGSAQPIDMLSFSLDVGDESCKKAEEEGNPYLRGLQEIGYEVQQLLDAGEAVSDELYVRMITTKIRSLFPEHIPKSAPDEVQPDALAGDEEVLAQEADTASAGAVSTAAAQDEREEEAAVPVKEPDELEGQSEEAAEEADDEATEGEIVADVTRPALASLDDTAAGAGAAHDAAAGVSIDDGGLSEPFGWVLVGFPEGAPQLGLLERVLSGWVEPANRPRPEAELRKAEAALLVPRPPEEPPPFALTPGGYDLHFRLDVNGDEAVRRAVGRRCDPQTSLTYHLEDAPPITKRHLIYERLVPVDDLASSIGTLTQRVHLFDLAQGDLDTSLSYFGPMADMQRLIGVDSNRTQDEVYDSIDEQVAMLLDRKRAQHAKDVAEAQAAAAAAAAAAEEAAAEAAAAQGRTSSPEDAAKPEGQDKVLSSQPSRAASPAVPDRPTTAASSQKSQPVAAPSPPPPPEPLQLSELSKYVEKLEEPAFGLLAQQWDELQTDFVSGVRLLSSWHRAHLADFRGGLQTTHSCFISFLQRPDDKQALVDRFIADFNSFSEEYPDMRKQDETKDELHQRSDDLGDKLRAMIEERREENMQHLEVLQKSQWLESQFEIVAAEVQYAVQMEATRYQAACQLLSDFYFSAMNMGLPSAKDPPPKIDVLSLDDKPADETTAEPKKKGKDDKKAKKPPPQEEVQLDLPPEERAALRLRRFVEASTDPESGAALPARWEFPFLPKLMEKAKAVVWELAEFASPATAEKAEPEVPEGGSKKKDAKKGRSTPDPGTKQVESKPPPQLYVDLQNALVAEKITFLHRLSVIKDWAERRLLSMTESSADMFSKFRDWVLLRRRIELDAVAGLTDAVKEIIESEELITSQLVLEGAHLNHHSNVRLRPPAPPPEIPVGLEAEVPYRWTVSKLDRLLDAVVGASVPFAPGARTVPAQSLFALLARATETTPLEEQPRMELAQVPADWGRVGSEKLQSLCNLFSLSPSGGIDCVEFLLGVGLLHSPPGWPSLDTLMEVRRALEARMPAGASWPDFWITAEEFAELSALVADPDSGEAAKSSGFQGESEYEPAPFDRAREQLRWLGRVLQRFRAPLRQYQAWEVEAAWHDYSVRKVEEVRRDARLLNDATPVIRLIGDEQSAPGTPRDQPSNPPSDMGGLVTSMEEEHDSDDLPEMPSEPRPLEPEGLQDPPSGAISVRQFMSYLCQGSSPEDGLSRALVVLCPGADFAPPSLADVHACLLQLGARPTPPAVASDGRPFYPSLGQFYEEVGAGVERGSLKIEELVANVQFQRFMQRSGLGRRHCRAQLERLFPKGS